MSAPEPNIDRENVAAPQRTAADRAVPEPSLQPVSPKLVTTRLICLALVVLPVLAAALALAFVFDAPAVVFGLVGVAWLVVTVWITVVIIRQVPALGYACREDDLLIERGIMLRRSTLVPYGRMQFVEVSQGPIARRFGLASVELHTAAALSEASIDGLPKQEAESLRDALAARGESNLAGL